MSENPSEMQPEDPDELRREIRERGARVAYGALLEVCRDPKAPAPAKATAGTTILRVGGYLDHAETKPDDALATLSDKDLARLARDLSTQVEALEQAQATAVGDGKKAGKPMHGPKKDDCGLFD